MVRFIVISAVATTLLLAGCIPFLEPLEPYVSTDYGANDYLPLAVGNEWQYQYIVKYEGGRPYIPGSYVSGRFEWSVTQVRKYNDTTEEFTLTTKRLDEQGNVIQSEFKILRSTSLITFGAIMPRTGTDYTLFVNNKKFGKGVGFFYQPIKSGYSGGTNGIGAWTETLELVSKTIKK